MYDSKTSTFTKLGKQMCKEIRISQETIIPKQLSKFEAEFNDPEIAHLHHKHFVNRRQKNLLRIT